MLETANPGLAAVELVASCYESITTVCRRLVASGLVLWQCALGLQLHWRSWLRLSAKMRSRTLQAYLFLNIFFVLYYENPKP